MSVRVPDGLRSAASTAVADRLFRQLQADSVNRGVIMDRGSIAWTPHPHYFADARVWSGTWNSIAGAISLSTVLSSVVMTYFLRHATGVRLAEKFMADRDGYVQYRSRTSVFVPRSPRSRIS